MNGDREGPPDPRTVYGSESSAPARIHKGGSVQSIALAAGCRLIMKNAIRIWGLNSSLNWPVAAIDSAVGLMPRIGATTVTKVKLSQCNAEFISAPDTSASRAVLYIHGGGFLVGGLNTHRALVSRISTARDAAVLNVGYRLLPDHSISDAVSDCLDGFRWLVHDGYPPESIVIAGDSAGGTLAFMAALHLAELGGKMPAGIATVSPLTDFCSSRRRHHRNARRCSMFSATSMPLFAKYAERCYERLGLTGGYRSLTSPVDADLSTLPPVAIHAGSDELLLHDAELMADRLGKAHVRCDLHVWEGQVHDFPLAADLLPEGRRAIDCLGEFIGEVTAPRRSATPFSNPAA